MHSTLSCGGSERVSVSMHSTATTSTFRGSSNATRGTCNGLRAMPPRSVSVTSPLHSTPRLGSCAAEGVLRPGIKRHGEQFTDDGSAGSGYSVTPRGREWLAEAARYDHIPTEPGRFATILAGFTSRFGAGYGG